MTLTAFDDGLLDGHYALKQVTIQRIIAGERDDSVAVPDVKERFSYIHNGCASYDLAITQPSQLEITTTGFFARPGLKTLHTMRKN